MLPGDDAFNMVGTVESIALGGYGLPVDVDIEVLRWIRLNGDGTGVYKNAPRDAVAVSHEKQHNNGCCYEKGEREQPKKHTPTNRTHTEKDEVA